MYPLQNLFIVGPMGVGKTTIGKLLAERLKRPFLDTDKVIIERCGADIPWIFDVEGEAGFRKREAQVCDELTQQQGMVIATGGGIVLNPDNRRNLSSRGIVIYLRASIEELVARTAKDKNRPLLQTSDPRSVIERILEEREPLYLDVADHVIDTKNDGARAGVAQILKAIQE